MATTEHSTRGVDPALKNLRFLGLRQVLDLLSVGRSTLYAQIKDPEMPFPAPIHLGRRSVWIESEVQEFMQMAVASSREAKPSNGRSLH